MITFSFLLMTLLGFSGLFLIGLILLQRGRGGGLAGAFGGIGGQSAFGTKAGDVFTRITIGVAAAWILLCAGSVVALHNSTTQLVTGFADPEKVKAENTKAESERAERNREIDRNSGADLNLEGDENAPAEPQSSATEAPSGSEKPEVKAESTTPVDPAESKPDQSPAESDKKPEEPKP